MLCLLVAKNYALRGQTSISQNILLGALVPGDVSWLHKFRGGHAVRAFQVTPRVKSLPPNTGGLRDSVRSLGQKDPWEKGMAAHSRILACRIPWTEESGGL